MANEAVEFPTQYEPMVGDEADPHNQSGGKEVILNLIGGLICLGLLWVAALLTVYGIFHTGRQIITLLLRR
jgi:hypothetical protein